MNRGGLPSNPVNQPPNRMKATLLSLLAVVSVFGSVTSASAQAMPSVVPMGVQPYPGERRIVSYLTNGMPVYAVYQAVGFDAMGFPIYQWVTQPSAPLYVRPYYRGYHYRTPIYVRPTYVRPNYVMPHFGAHVSPPVHHGGSTHLGGPVSHGGGHVSHGGGGHVGHGGGHHR